jgi:uncharacterized membrane protein
MNRTLKWIIGILIALLALAVIAAVAYFGFGRWYGYGMMGASRFPHWEGRGTMPMHPGDYWGRPGFGSGGFFWLGMLPRLLFNLGILTFIVLGVVYLVRLLSGQRHEHTATSPQTPTLEATASCSNCGKPVQADWSHCPYCGNTLS